MNISDILSDAAADVERILEANPQVYAGFRDQIEAALRAMDDCRAALDRVPENGLNLA